jgi:hypothetical protein
MTMSEPARGERYPLHIRDLEKSSDQIHQLVIERYGTIDQIRHERIKSPSEQRHGT